MKRIEYKPPFPLSTMYAGFQMKWVSPNPPAFVFLSSYPGNLAVLSTHSACRYASHVCYGTVLCGCQCQVTSITHLLLCCCCVAVLCYFVVLIVGICVLLYIVVLFCLLVVVLLVCSSDSGIVAFFLTLCCNYC